MAEANTDQIRLRGTAGVFSDREYPIEKGEFVVGRLSGCDLIIKEDTISSRHAKILRGEESYEVLDLDSTNGTFVNDERVQRKLLRTGDKVKFDIFEFEFINPKDVPRTVLADAPGEDIPEKTIISPSLRGAQGEEQTVRIPPPEQTIKLPDRDETVRLPAEEPTEPIRERQPEQHQPPVKHKPVSIYKKSKSGNLFGGVALGLLLALVIGYIGAFLGIWSNIKFSMDNVLQQFVVAGTVFPQFLLPTHWLEGQLSFSAVIIIAGIILGLIAGGLVMQHFSRKSRVIGSFWLALFYMIIVLAVQLAVMQFQFRTFINAYTTVGLGCQAPSINIAFTVGSIFIVGYIFSFIGSLFSRK